MVVFARSFALTYTLCSCCDVQKWKFRTRARMQGSVHPQGRSPLVFKREEGATQARIQARIHGAP